MSESADNPPTAAWPDERGDALRSPDVRAFAIGSGLGRIAIGVGLAFAPRRALAVLGFEDSPSVLAVSRLAGGRDIVIGALTLAAMDDAESLRVASLASAAVDAGDAATFGASLLSGAGPREAAWRGLAAAVPATLAGLWVARRLSR